MRWAAGLVERNERKLGFISLYIYICVCVCGFFGNFTFKQVGFRSEFGPGINKTRT